MSRLDCLYGRLLHLCLCVCIDSTEMSDREELLGHREAVAEYTGEGPVAGKIEEATTDEEGKYMNSDRYFILYSPASESY